MNRRKMTRSTIAWFSMWMSWYIVILPAVHSEEATVKGGPIEKWNSGASYNLIDGILGKSWVLDTRKETYLKTCGIGQEADFWTITNYVKLNTTFADEIHVDVEVELTLCFYPGNNSHLPCYTNYFEVYIYRGTDNTTIYKPANKPNLDYLLKVYSPLYNIRNNTLPNANLTRSIKTFSFPQTNSQGVSFAIRSRGACGSIFRMKMYYYYCKETFIKGIKFERTPSPANGFKNVTGNCSEYAIPLNNAMASFNIHCDENGTWSEPEDDKCFCIEGYAPDKTDGSCSSCSNTSYKKNISNDNCTECPMNTVSNMNRTSCVCEDGYYKSSSDKSELSPCYALPVISKKPRTRRIAYGVELSWTAPKSSLNETILYNVRCFICNQTICDISCRNETYDPGPNNLSQTWVTVSNLIAADRYVFRVYARNSLNDEVPEDEWGYNETDPIQVTSDTTTRDPSFSTAIPATTDDDNSIIYIIIGVIAAVLLILIILLIICIRRRKKNGVKKPSIHGYVNEGVELPSVGRRLYVDPSNYDDPEAAVQEFASELDSKMIFLERMIGGGEFGDVYKGELTTTDRKKIPIAAKTLKHNADAKSERDFMLEASVMGQFNNPNIVLMEGVVTKSIPRMIILEFMSNGSLDNYLKSNDGLLTNLQLIGMARGVAAGMKYLAEIHFVHRDLAARNILVNDSLLCKIADFGLSRELEEKDTSRGEYSTKGGKIPVRWTAPEAIKFRKFSTASDVWSYGILFWEIITFAERPYWEWDNMKVVEKVDQGFRLPSPQNCPKGVHDLMLQCWKAERSERPSFARITIVIDKWIRSPETMKDEIGFLSPIGEWLASIKMSSYETTFVEASFTFVTDIVELTDEDLITIGITLIGHRNKIMKGINSLRDKDKKKRQSMTI